MEKQLLEVTQDLEDFFGKLLLNKESINALNVKLGGITEDVRNTDQSNMQELAFRLLEDSHTLYMLADLLNYVTKELNGYFEDGYKAKNKLFDLAREINEKQKA